MFRFKSLAKECTAVVDSVRNKNRKEREEERDESIPQHMVGYSRLSAKAEPQRKLQH